MVKMITQWFTILLIAIFSLFFVGCLESKESTRAIVYAQGEVSRTSKDIKIPQELADEIESIYLTSYKKINPETAKEDIQILSQIARKYLVLDILFEEDLRGPLIANTQFYLPRGGGVIDLANYIQNDTGQFTIKFKVQLPGAEDNKASIDDVKVYFLSETPQRSVAGKPYGGGCDKYFDVTSLYQKQLSQKGLDLIVNHQRYINIIGGTFVLVLPYQEDLYLGAISFYDSRHPGLFCTRVGKRDL